MGGSSWKRCKLCGKKGHTMGDCPSVTECSHCGCTDHRAKRCTFGSKPSERFLPCVSLEPRWPCFWRRFLVPLRRASATEFDVENPRQGRADVGLRCTSATLCRSQGLRRNSQVCLSFEGSGHTLEISGALARDLRPDEACLATRLKAGLDAGLRGGDGPPDPEQDPEGWSASLLRGFEVHPRSTQKALVSMLKTSRSDAESSGGGPPRVAVLLLTEDGIPMAKACSTLRQDDQPPLAGVVTVLGDDRGIPDDECRSLETIAEKHGAEVIRVSLGGTTLLASHAIVLVHHYLDERLHRCQVAQPRNYGHAALPGDEKGEPARKKMKGPA